MPEGDVRAAQEVELAGSPVWQGTAAVTEAWLSVGDRLAAKPEVRGEYCPRSEAQVAAWARALVEAPTDRLRGDALRRIARFSADHVRIDALGQLLQAMRGLSSGSVSAAERAPLELTHALYTGDVDAAGRAWDEAVALHSPEASLFSDPRLRPAFFDDAEQIELRGEALTLNLPLDPSPSAFTVRSGEMLSLVSLLPDVHRVAGPVPWPAAAPSFPIWTAAGPRPRRPSETSWENQICDVDGDGETERYVVWERDLLRVDEAHPDGAPIIPELGRSNSELRLHCADLDGDGQDELLVGLGEWRGYDLRVYEGGPEGYHLRARTGRTATTAITTVPDPAGPGRLIVSLEADTHSNANRHGLHDPDGPPSAVLLRRLEGDRLKDLWAWPLPGEFERVGAFAAGDLDGDGAEELVFGLSSGSHYLLFLGRLRADAAGFAFGVHPGLYPYALQQLDGDSAPELIVGRLPPGETVPTASEVRWILGRGGAGFPSLPPAPPAAGLEVPAPDLRGGAERVWRDAALLVGAGLRQSAAELLLRSATEAHDPLRATAAADLWTTMGHEADAARAEEQGAWSSPPGDAAPRWQAAVERWLHAAEPDEALRVAEAWRAADGAGPSGALADRLQAWSTARASSLRLEPGVAPGADWDVVEPLAFDPRAGQTHIDSLGGQPRLAALSLQPTGGPVALFLDLTIERLEWNSASRVGFGGGPLRSGVTFGASGAEKVHTFRAFFEGCVGDAEQPSSMNQHLTLPPSPTAERPALRMRARFSWSPGDGSPGDGSPGDGSPGDGVWRCSIELPDLGQAHSAARPLALPAALDLSLGDLREDTGSWQRFRLDRLEVWGVRAAPTRGDPLQAARQAALREDPTRALALLPSDAALERAILLGRLRRPAEAIAAFQVALETDRPTLLRRVAWLLRAHRDTYSPLLRAASGPDWPTLFDAAWNIPVIGNHQAPWIDEALRTELEAVPLPAVGGDPAWFVLCYRAMALLHGPEPERGRAAAAEWLAAFDRLSPGVEAPERRLASLLHRELALDALTRGDRATAQVEADRAVERSPTPTLAPDFFRLSPVWQAAGLPVPVSRPAPEPGTPSPPSWAD